MTETEIYILLEKVNGRLQLADKPKDYKLEERETKIF